MQGHWIYKRTEALVGKLPEQNRSNNIKNLSKRVSLGQEEVYFFLWNERVKTQVYDFMEGGKLSVFLLRNLVFLY